MLISLWLWFGDEIPPPPSGEDPVEDADPVEEVREVHWTQVEIKKTHTPKFPSEVFEFPPAPGLVYQDGNLRQHCKIRIFIDEQGVPHHTQIEDCPQEYQSSATEAVMKWRFKPMTVNGKRVKSQFILTIEYDVNAQIKPAQVQWVKARALIPGTDQEVMTLQSEPPVDYPRQLSFPPDGSRLITWTTTERDCVLDLSISETGEMTEYEVVDCPVSLLYGSVKSVETTVFQPVIVEGKPVEAIVRWTGTYRLTDI